MKKSPFDPTTMMVRSIRWERGAAYPHGKQTEVGQMYDTFFSLWHVHYPQNIIGYVKICKGENNCDILHPHLRERKTIITDAEVKFCTLYSQIAFARRPPKDNSSLLLIPAHNPTDNLHLQIL